MVEVHTVSTSKEERRLAKLKWIIFGFSLLQVYRLVMMGFVFYVIYEYLIVEKITPPMFDGGVDTAMEGSTSDMDYVSPYMYEEQPFKRFRRYSDDYYSEPDEEMETKPRSEVTWFHILQLTVPIAEVVSSLVVLSLIFGPLSAKVSPRMWIVWIVNMRIFWMRLLWTATAVAFVAIESQFHATLYKETRNPRYLGNHVADATMAMEATEYCLLGIVETTIKIMSMDRLKSRLMKLETKMSTFWWIALKFDYYACLLVYVLRNFCMSLYFGILTAFVTQDTVVTSLSESKKDVMGNVTVVLQIYLALIRGRFYGFFMHNFLSNFFVEEGDVMFCVNMEKGDVIRKQSECGVIFEEVDVIRDEASRRESVVERN